METETSPSLPYREAGAAANSLTDSISSDSTRMTMADETQQKLSYIPAPKIATKKMTSLVGFSNLPNQWHLRSLRKGFNFNLMVVGESGLGKSTMVNTLFNKNISTSRGGISSSDPPKTISIQSTSAEIVENGVRLRLTVVDTPGFGDFVNNEDAWGPIVDNIEKRFHNYLDAENQPSRQNITDDRIHACIYFIQPTGHCLKSLDIEVMKKLHTKVNLIPVIAKADTMTDDSIEKFKERILADIKENKITIFEGPNDEVDEESVAENLGIMSKVPFAVVGSTNVVTLPGGQTVRGRQYPWGVVEVDNDEHCDFLKLRQMLIKTHMEELREHTNNSLYESYRTEKLEAMGFIQDHSVFKEINPESKREEAETLHRQKLLKMESEMQAVFNQKVSEKEAKLRQSEQELTQRHKEMKDELMKQKIKQDEEKSKLEALLANKASDQFPSKTRKGFSLR